MNRTVLRTVEILEIIARNDEISLAELVRITGYPKTSVYDILHALEDRAMIYRCKDKICYGIGFRAYAIGRTYSKNSDLLNSAEIYMKELADDIGKTVLMGKIDRNKILYIAKSEPQHPIVLTPSIGDEEPIKNTSFAKIAEVFTHHEKRICQLTKEEKSCIRTNKLATYGFDQNTPFYNIASPIYNFESRLSGVLAVFGVKEDGRDYELEQEKIKACTRRISEKLGYVY
ncbi:hypothetical protein D7X87_04495 [bacterium D16-54]|nr:hypothetical protein D7X87_04495 [bacterium D16-54]RKJ16039.1 hypothetical protein D7X65_04490 [bacterium D16-56]